MKKLLIITYYWPPSGGPGVQRWLKFSIYLRQAGYEPIIITVDPSEATYPIADKTLLQEVPPQLRVEYTSTLEPYNFYKKLSGRKQVPYSGFTNETKKGFFSSLSRFIRGNLFIPDARVGWNRYAFKKAENLILSEDISTVITTSPPHSTQLVGMKIKRKFPHINWLADLRDPWTDIFYYSKMLHLPVARAKDSRLELGVLLNADHVITVGIYLKEMLAKKIPHSIAEKIKVISNGFDDEDFIDPAPQKPDNTFTIVYTGTLSDEYDLSGFINALMSLPPQIRSGITLQFTGNVSDKWKFLLLNQLGFIINISGHTDHRSAVRQMRSSHLLLLVIPCISQNEGIVTGKIFEYMASGSPILGIGPPGGDASRILSETATGKMFDYSDEKAIQEFLQEVISKPYNFNPLREVIDRYSRRQLTDTLTTLF